MTFILVFECWHTFEISDIIVKYRLMAQMMHLCLSKLSPKFRF